MFEKSGFQEQCSYYKQTPRGGIYMLPPPLPIQDVPAAEQSHSDPIVPGLLHLCEGGVGSAWRTLNVIYRLNLMSRFLGEVEILGPTAAVTKCPSCAEVVTTETHNTRGAAMWIMCFLCSIMG